MSKRTHADLTASANDNGCIFDDFDGCGSFFCFASQSEADGFFQMLRRIKVECVEPFVWEMDSADLDLADEDRALIGGATALVYAIECASIA